MSVVALRCSRNSGIELLLNSFSFDINFFSIIEKVKQFLGGIPQGLEQHRYREIFVRRSIRA